MTDTDMRHWIGRLLTGRYELKRLLGQGGFGTVFGARDAMIERDVAIKVLHPDHLASRKRVQAFMREARIMGRLRHPNIVQILDFGRDGTDIFIVMELIVGHPLNDLLDAPTLSALRIVQLGEQILLALEEAHEAGVVHRDLKPDNIYVETLRDGRELVKVLDFGIARLLVRDAPRTTPSEIILGTPEYMSPEQCRDQPVDRRSDLYAFGCLLYRMVVGHPPFSSQVNVDVLMGHIFRDPPPLSAAHLVCPEAIYLEPLIFACLQKNPADRPPNARSVRTSLLGLQPSQHLSVDVPLPTRVGFAQHRSVGAESTEHIRPPTPMSVLVFDSNGELTSLSTLAKSDLSLRFVKEMPSLAEMLAFDVTIISGRVEQYLATCRSLMSNARAFLICGPDDDLGTMAKALELGAFEYLPLPVDVEAVARAVGRIARQRRKNI